MRHLIIFGLCLLILASAIDIPSKIEQDFNSISSRGVDDDHNEGIIGKAARVVRDAAEGVADTLTAGDLAAKEALIRNTPVSYLFINYW